MKRIRYLSLLVMLFSIINVERTTQATRLSQDSHPSR